jgi:hypothetical protein
MTAPNRAPWFCDAIAGVERTFPDTGDDVRYLIDDLAWAAERDPHWQIDSHHELRVTLAIIEHIQGQRLVVAATAGGVTATITAEPDPSGWLKLTALCAGITLTAYMDRPYEEYSLLPADSPLPPRAEEPGRMGKRRTWLSLHVSAWPELAPLAPQGWFNVAVVE